jgi:photosystem II stability/assembly factor-like uncharacterized protein
MGGITRRFGVPSGVWTRFLLGAALAAGVIGVGLPTFSGASPTTASSTEVLTGVSCFASICNIVGSTNPSGGAAVVARSTNGGDTWRAQKTSTAVEILNGVSCVSKTSCKAVGETKKGAPVIVASPITGVFWPSETPPAADGDLLSIVCISTTFCWAGGYSAGFASGAIAETADGGATWSPDSVPGGPTGVQEVTGVTCKGSPTIHCFATGNWANYGQSPYLMRSTSTVKTWTDVTTLPKPTGVPGTLEGASCLTAKACVFVGNDADYFVLTTTNGGSTFTKKVVPSGVTGLMGVSCVSTSDCTAVGSASDGAAAILRSTNGGATWSSQTAPTGTGSLNSVSCASATHCVAVGQEDTGGPAVLVTTDGGTIWSSVTAPT